MGGNRNQVIDGTYGLTLTLPGEWEILDQSGPSGSWMNARGDILFIEHPPLVLLVRPEMIHEYRHDLRLIAARDSGGLIECDLVNGLGVFGITKRPRPDGPGMNFFLHGLVPTDSGHASLVLVCAEGAPVGLRTSEVGRRLEADHWTRSSWMQDPYGFDDWEGESSLFSRWKEGSRHRLTEPSCLRTPADDVKYDAEFPEHPLSRMRAFSRSLATIGSATPRAEMPRPRGHAELGYSFGLPPGFLPFEEGFLDDGIVHRRVTFEDRSSRISLRRHAGAAECGGSRTAAKQHVSAEATRTESRLLWGPDATQASVGDLEGTRVESDSLIKGRPSVTVSFYFASGKDALEVSCISDIDDRRRCDRLLRQVLPTLKNAWGN